MHAFSCIILLIFQKCVYFYIYKMENTINKEELFYKEINLILEKDGNRDIIENFIDENIKNGNIDTYFNYDYFVNKNKNHFIEKEIFFLEYLSDISYTKLEYNTRKEVLNSLAFKKWKNSDFNDSLNIISRFKKDFKDNDLANVINNYLEGLSKLGISKINEALYCFYDSLENLEKFNIENIDLWLNIKNNIGLVYVKQNDIDSALKIFLYNLSVLKKSKKQQGIAKSLMNLGNVYALKNMFSKAIIYSLKAQKILYDQGNIEYVERLNCNISDYYFNLKKYEISKKYANKCLVSSDFLTQKLISIVLLKLELNIFKKGEKCVEDKKKLNEIAIVCKNNVNELKVDFYKIENYPYISKAFEYAENYTEAIKILNKSNELYAKQAEQEKIATYKQLRETHELQVQQQEIEQQEKTNLKLKGINNDLEQFTYMASHDLKSPLRNISAFCSFIEDENTSKEEIKEYTGLIKKDANKMTNLITSLLDYSKIGFNEVEKESIDLTRLLKKVIEGLNQNIEEKNAVVSFDNLENIEGNAILLNQLFNNLINNALKYNDKETPRIEINGNQINQKLQISIKDNGIGIPENKIPEIFNAFTRAHSASKYKGSGVGLAICKKIMDIHSGTIAVSSEVGKGTCFTLVFNNED